MLSWLLPGSWLQRYTRIEAQDKSTEELFVPSLNKDCEFDSEDHHISKIQRSLWKWKAAALALCGLLVLLIGVNVALVMIASNTSEVPIIYSPAESAVEYETVVFHNNFHEDRTPYQGPPNDAVDTAWDDLYHNVGIIQIDKKSAEQLPNRTLPIPGDDENFIVGIEVFHQLHCLNSIRKALYPERYREKENLTDVQLLEYQIHLEHCVDSIRQTVQCYSDINTIPWIWNTLHNRPAPDAHTTHICRKFDKIQDWARARAFTQEEYNIRLAAQEHV